MELDLNKFRILQPVNELFEESLLFLAEHTKVWKVSRGTVLSDQDQPCDNTLYLMAGKVLRVSNDEKQSIISSGTERALQPICQAASPPRHLEVASEQATLARIDNLLLERLLSWEQLMPEQSAVDEKEIAEGPSFEESTWMMAMLQTKTFQKLPAANIQFLFERMVEVDVRAGDVIIRKGDPGEYFYVIREGRCRVTLPSSSGEMILAELDRCSSFGEQALISDEPRNATVTMVTNGKLMRMSKSDFTELMTEPLMNRVNHVEALSLVQEGAIPIDVRFGSESRRSSLSNAINIPIQHLRSRILEFDPEKQYILFCNNGQRSSVAAFILSQHGLNVHVLDGGIGN